MMKQDKKLNTAVVGLGYWGPNLARNFQSSKHFDLKYLCDRDQKRLGSLSHLYPQVKMIDSLDAMLASGEVQVVAIATPVDSHFTLAKKALEGGCHVLLEKPMTRTVAEAKELKSIADANERVLMIDHTFNYTSSVQKIKNIVESGVLGDILYWDSVRINLGLFQHDVNVIWDLAPHDLAIMDYVLDQRVVGVQATGIAHYADKIENIAYLTLHFENKLIAHFHLNWLAPVKLRTTLIGGTKKMIVYDDMNNSEKVKIYDKGVDLGESKEGVYKTLIQYRSGDMYAPKIDNNEALQVEIEHFYKVIQGEESPISSAEAGIRVVSVLEASQESIENNGKLIKI